MQQRFDTGERCYFVLIDGSYVIWRRCEKKSDNALLYCLCSWSLPRTNNKNDEIRYTVEGGEANRARVLNILILYTVYHRHTICRGRIIGVFRIRTMRRYRIVMVLKKFIVFFFLFVRDKSSVRGRECDHSGLSRQVGGGAWRWATAEGRLVPYLHGRKSRWRGSIRPTCGVRGKWVAVSATGRRRDDAAQMETFAGARSLYGGRRRRCTGTRVRNITSFACTRPTGNGERRETEKTERGRSAVWDDDIVPMAANGVSYKSRAGVARRSLVITTELHRSVGGVSPIRLGR